MNINDFQLKPIKQTNHSLIYSGIRKHDNLTAVIKLLKRDYVHPEALNRYYQEYEIISSLDNPGVIKAYDLIRHQNRLAIVLENFAGQSLSDILQSQSLEIAVVLAIAIKIAKIFNTLSLGKNSSKSAGN